MNIGDSVSHPLTKSARHAQAQQGLQESETRLQYKARSNTWHSFTVKLEMINVYRIGFFFKKKIKEIRPVGETNVWWRKSVRRGKPVLQEVSDCTWRTEKLNLINKEKFATIQLNSVVKQHKNTEISQRFRYLTPHVPGADSTIAQ